MIESIRAWATAIAELGPEATRTVLVPSEAHAHALRVELLAHAPRTLAGARFLTILGAAQEVLDWTETRYREGEELRRGLRFRQLLRGGLSLPSFAGADLLAPGWQEAFVATLAQLESAGLSSASLASLAALEVPRAVDVSTVWRLLDAEAGASWTAPRIVAEACARLEATSAAWPLPGPTLAYVHSGLSAIEARFLRAIPRRALAVLAARPVRARVLERSRAWFGPRVAALTAAEAPAGARSDELGILAAHLFEPPSRLADPARARSAGPDGSVALELHAGVADELDAAARWVAEQIVEHGTPLQDLALLVPVADPWLGLVADRLAELPWPGPSATLPVHVAGGRLATSTGAGARLLALACAIERHLPRGAMLELLPRLQREGDRRAISPRDARDAVRALATRGGSPSHPERAAEWRRRLAVLDVQFATRGLGGAIDALASAAEAALAGAPLAEIWRAVRALATDHLVGSVQLRAIVALLDAELRALAADPVVADVRGLEALRFLILRLRALRIGSGRYGEPSVYVGTVAEAAGLPFSAVRILGISEGVFPGILREDPILPGRLFPGGPPLEVSSDEDFAVARLHAFEQVIRGARDRLVISSSVAGLDGAERGPAAVFVELAAALARPDASTGARARGIPRPEALVRDAFRPALEAARRRRAAQPLTPRCWHERVARGARELPRAWSAEPITAPAAIAERAARPDGELGPSPLTVGVPGLGVERPISASALQQLLECPQRFLLEHVLHRPPLEEPDEPHRLPSLEYGRLVHEIAEQFARAHGAAFGRRAESLAHWLEVADSLARRSLAAHLADRPLATEGDVDAERRRLLRDVRIFVEHDWGLGAPRTFVAAEQELDPEGGRSIETSDGPLFVSGRIDRVDLEEGALWIRDLKTGRAPARRRDPGPDVGRDVQLALYVAAAPEVAARLQLPALPVCASYVHLDPFIAASTRELVLDSSALQRCAAQWFGVAAALLRDRVFMRTSDARECGRCAFAPVCGEPAARASSGAHDEARTRARFLELRA